MPKNLREKLALILADCETLQQFELLQRLERLVMEEVNFLAGEHKIDSFDLTAIRARSITRYSEMNMSQEKLGKIYQDGELVRVLCMTDSVIEFLRSKGLINFVLTFNKK